VTPVRHGSEVRRGKDDVGVRRLGAIEGRFMAGVGKEALGPTRTWSRWPTSCTTRASTSRSPWPNPSSASRGDILKVLDSFDQDVKTFLSAIVLCMQNRLATPALALMFTLIDTMAWLSLGEEAVEVRGTDFERWVDQFLLPGSGLLCTASDLYAARCALLHTHSAESRKSRAGTARELLYAWGDREERQLQAGIKASQRDACALHVNKLCRALPQAIDRFVASLDQDPARARVAWQRAQKICVRIDIPRVKTPEQEQHQ